MKEIVFSMTQPGALTQESWKDIFGWDFLYRLMLLKTERNKNFAKIPSAGQNTPRISGKFLIII